MGFDPPQSVLCRLGRLYEGPDPCADAPEPAPSLSLRALGEALGAPVGPPPRGALVLVVGEPGSGKSAFLNALVQELALPLGAREQRRPRERPPLQWLRPGAAPGSAPPLLAEASRRFPGWPPHARGGLAGCCAACGRLGPRAEGLELVEAAPHCAEEDAEPLLWLAARADLVVCLLDSQRQPGASDALLQWLGRVAGAAEAAGGAAPELQFALSRADLLARESDRIRLLAKASRLLSERLGRGFEVLPAAAGDLRALLDGLGPGPAPEGAGGGRAQDGLLRAGRAAERRAARRAAEGLEALRGDCERLGAALEAQELEARARRKAQLGASPLRPKLAQCSGAMVIVAAVVPFFLDEDVEPWVAHACVAAAAILAVLLLLVAAILPSSSGSAPETAASGTHVAILAEQRRFMRLVQEQCKRWCDQGLRPAQTDPLSSAGEHLGHHPDKLSSEVRSSATQDVGTASKVDSRGTASGPEPSNVFV